jgi:hypothetical protein
MHDRRSRDPTADAKKVGNDDGMIRNEPPDNAALLGSRCCTTVDPELRFTSSVQASTADE